MFVTWSMNCSINITLWMNYDIERVIKRMPTWNIYKWMSDYNKGVTSLSELNGRVNSITAWINYQVVSVTICVSD